MKEIKLHAYTPAFIEQQVETYKKYGYFLLEIRPSKWWESGDFIAVMAIEDSAAKGSE